ncbi:DUF11 domain-containing protein [Candidatus Mycosynbacter amalyticus]|uniref:DUF11 domain-containing protein n=1 Tax=Candidatus Mycosynbacter amalyticus TaxID=2665156 RepID=A0A857MIY1_9BACT|nr:DUF11 domain-containing protein [Candidatus Mycosynbacter amalyticus]QHN42503.1 DUF11 domain-containing protein [Candidatus Mycosynbacter amalyticus]
MKTTYREAMKNINSRVAAVLVVSAAIVGLSTQAMAWGPERPTTSGETGADYVTFNSITDNKKVGDERNFVRIREAGTGEYINDMKVQPGKQYEVMTYYHNNAKTSLNASGAGIAKDVSVRTKMPSVVKASEKGTISSVISSSNANPKEVWDEAYVTTDTDVALKYISGSATITSNGPVNGQVLPDSLFSTGTLIGYDSLNGVLPGCAQYSGFVIYKFRVDAPNFTVSKQVSPTGQKQWQENYAAKPGERVDYKVIYTNTGTTAQNDVNIKDTLPKGMVYMPGSTKVYNTANPSGRGVSDNIVSSGINIGNYAAGGNAVITYSATVAAANELNCNANTLTNKVSAITSGGAKDDTATVTVNVSCAASECKPGVPTGDARCGACTPTEGQVVDANGNCVVASGSLPTTGPAETILTIIGVGALTAGFAYWYRSRKNLKKALAGVDLEHEAAAHDAPKLLKARTDSHVEDDKKDF